MRRHPLLPQGSLTLALALPLVLSGSAQALHASPAQEDGPGVGTDEGATAQDDAAPETDARARKRILHLASGQVLRAIARPAGDGWEIRQGRDRWVALPAGSVLSAPLERDVLAQARSLERELQGEDDDPGRRVAYAGWLANQGLVEEAVDQLDRTLTADPDQPQALALIPTLHLRTNLPALDTSPAALDDSLEALCRAAARSGQVGRELAVAEIAAAREAVPDLAERLQKELHVTIVERRAFAALALRRLFPGDLVRPLLGRAILDASSHVRNEAALGLRAVGDASVIVPAVRALGSSSPVVRENAMEAMAVMGYPAAVEPILTHMVALKSSGGTIGRPPHANIFVGRQFAFVQDFDVEVAQGAAIADPVINVGVEGAVLDAGVIGVTEYRVQSELANARRALVRLTGVNPGYSVRAWQRWWDENGDAWKAANLPPGPPASPTSPAR